MGFNSAFKGLNTKLNPICHFLALLGAHPVLHVSKIRVKGHLLVVNTFLEGTVLNSLKTFKAR